MKQWIALSLMTLAATTAGAQKINLTKKNHTGKLVAQATKTTSPVTASSTASSTSSGSSTVDVSETATPTAKSKFSGTWAAGLDATREVTFNGTEEKADTAANKMTGALGIQTKYKIVEDLTLSLNVGVTFISGHTLDTDETSGKPSDNKISVSEAAANYDFSKHFSTKVGIMRQFGVLHSAAVMYKSSFPTLRLTATTGAKDDNKLELITQASVPTAMSNASREQNEAGTPSMVGAAIVGAAKAGALEVSGKLSGFQFSNLNSAIAKGSEEGGNSVSAKANSTGSDVIYSFDNKFRGVDSTLDMGVTLSKNFKPYIGGTYTKNLEAKPGFAEAQTWNTGLEITFNENLVLTPEYGQFRVEPDAAISSYNYFQTNKVGYYNSLKLTIAKAFSISVSSADQDMLYVRKDQYYGRSTSIALETEVIPF